MKAILKGEVVNVFHMGNNIAVILDEEAEGGQRVVDAADITPMKKVINKRVYGRLVVTSNKRKRMNNHDKKRSAKRLELYNKLYE